MIPIVSFLPSLEENGLIEEVDLCIFEKSAHRLISGSKIRAKDTHQRKPVPMCF